jgi:hypothetical protein
MRFILIVVASNPFSFVAGGVLVALALSRKYRIEQAELNRAGKPSIYVEIEHRGLPDPPDRPKPANFRRA